MARFSRSQARILLLLIVSFTLIFVGYASAAPATTTTEVIVQAPDTATAARIVQQYDGDVTRDLPIIDSVVATADSETIARLRNDAAITAVWHNKRVEVTAGPPNGESRRSALPAGHYASVATGADGVHRQGITGKGATVAIVDSGFPFTPQLNPRQAGRPDGAPRDGSLFYEIKRDGQFILYKDFIDSKARHSKDPFGHGTHVAGSIIGSRHVALELGDETAHLGVAPDANLIIARAIGDDGSGTYADIIDAIGWIVEMRDIYGVDVLNMSLHASVDGPYWVDPMNQAVMKAWEAGITVVAAAGNDGPEPASVRAPGNVPYVITVGAYREGKYTDHGNPEVLEFSARGPTESRFVKPDVLMPGYKIVAPMPKDSYLAGQIGESVRDESGHHMFDGVRADIGYYPLSGTSMSTAQTSGVVALMLERDPGLTNNEIKARLMGTAAIAVADDDEDIPRAIYSIWEQGAGKANTYDAVFATTNSAANEGLDISADLDTGPDGIHYLGFTGIEDGTNAFVLGNEREPEGYFRWTGDHNVGSSGKWAWTGGKWAWTGGKWAWTGGNWVWTGGKWAWTGGKWAWTGGEWNLDEDEGWWVWTNGKWAWTGGKWAWTGGKWAWTGGKWAWTGGKWAWTGGKWAWTGGKWAWTGDEPIAGQAVELGIMPVE